MKAKVKYEAQGTKELMIALRGLSILDIKSLEDGWEPESYAVANLPDIMESSYRILSHDVLIHGDYDADGLCATAIAKLAIPDADIYIPSREDGYGLSKESIMELSEDKLVLTVDCGIGNLDDMQDAESEGRRFIVTDHHEPSAYNRIHTFPAVNPKISDLGYDGLSGSGVAFFFFRQLAMPDDTNHAIQLAAIGTMSDMMPVLQWNRPLIRTAIRSMKHNPCPAVKAMAYACKIDLMYVTEETLSWYFGPILNSAGRRGNLYAAAEMLYTKDFDRAHELALFLKKDKDQEKKEMLKASAKVTKTAPTFHTPGLVIIDGTKIPGISTGTTANHAMGEHGKPAMVYGMRDGVCVASIRCPDLFDAPALINKLIDAGYALDGGGHKGAAGLQWTPEETRNIIAHAEAYADWIYQEVGETETFDADIEIPLDHALALFEPFENLKPYGMGFEKPTFLSKINAFDDYRVMGKKKEHCAFSVFDTELVAFGLADKIPEDANSLMVVYEMSRNASKFGDAGKIQIIVRDAEVLS